MIRLRAGTSDSNATTLIAERYARSLFRREGYHRYADANGEIPCPTATCRTGRTVYP